MKITIKEKDEQEINKYPQLMKSDGMIYYFTSPEVGFNLTKGLWGQDYDYREFTPFTGTVELSND